MFETSGIFPVIQFSCIYPVSSCNFITFLGLPFCCFYEKGQKDVQDVICTYIVNDYPVLYGGNWKYPKVGCFVLPFCTFEHVGLFGPFFMCYNDLIIGDFHIDGILPFYFKCQGEYPIWSYLFCCILGLPCLSCSKNVEPPRKYLSCLDNFENCMTDPAGNLFGCFLFVPFTNLCCGGNST